MSASKSSETSELVLALLSAGHQIDDRLNGALEPYSLSLPKLTVLRNLVEAGGPLPLGVLSERLGCVKSNITQIVDRLEADKLVRRVPDPDDRRSVLAAITEEGQERYRAGRKALDDAEHEILAGLSPGDLDQLSGLLGRFLARGR